MSDAPTMYVHHCTCGYSAFHFSDSVARARMRSHQARNHPPKPPAFEDQHVLWITDGAQPCMCEPRPSASVHPARKLARPQARSPVLLFAKPKRTA